MFDRVNLLKELEKERERRQEGLLIEVKHWILDEHILEKNIFSTKVLAEELDINLFDKEDIFSLQDIRDIAIKYNLRFLDRALFKDEIPYEAIIKTKEIGRNLNIQFEHFKVLAPAEKFTLKDPNADPILFAQLSNDKFLFIHKWGKDMSWSKKLKAFPFRNLKTLLISIAVFSLVLSAFIPTEWLSVYSSHYFNFFRAILVFWIFVVSASITSYCWFLFGKDFSSAVWNSKYF